MNHGVTFHFGSTKVCSPAIFEASFSYDKVIWMATTDYCYVLLHNFAISIDCYCPVKLNEFYSIIVFSLLISAIELSGFNTLSLHTFSFSYMLFSLLRDYLDLYITDTALKVSRSLYCFTTSISHGVENCFARLWGTGISDAIIYIYNSVIV